MIKKFKNINALQTLLTIAFLLPFFSTANYPSIKLSLTIEDSVKVCKAVVMKSETEPASGAGVNFFVKRFFGMLPLGSTTSTDEHGMAKVNFPMTIPVDETGKVIVSASLEDDIEVVAEATSPWGIKRTVDDASKQNALWAPRSNVAVTLMVISNLIIVAIWGVMAYIVYLVFFRIRKVGISNQLN